MKLHFFFVILNAHFIFGQYYYPNRHSNDVSCTDPVSGKRGHCCPLRYCSVAQDYLRYNMQPLICDYQGFEPKICCPRQNHHHGPSYAAPHRPSYTWYPHFTEPTFSQYDSPFEYDEYSPSFNFDSQSPTYTDSDEFGRDETSFDGNGGLSPPSDTNNQLDQEKNIIPIVGSDEAPEADRATDEGVKIDIRHPPPTEEIVSNDEQEELKTTTESAITNSLILERNSSRRISDEKCEDFYPLRTTTTLAPGGFSIAAIGGQDSALDEFPHMVALGWRTTNNGAGGGGGVSFRCGGTLISDRYVLTAGHCTFVSRDTEVVSPEPALVRLGVVNIDGDRADDRQPLDVPILSIIRHPSYKPPSKYYDIALLELSRSVPRSARVRPACLWSQESLGDHTTAIVTGWGTTTNRGNKNSPILQKVDVDILNSSTCQPLLNPVHSRNWGGFEDHQLCAGVLQGGKDACQGDSGGPLQVIESDWRRTYYAVIGITSFGDQCAVKNKPGVYTRVSSFIDWIESVVWPENF